MKSAPDSDQRSKPNRSHAIREADVKRLIKGALAAGIEIREIVATRETVRILSGSSVASAINSWDEVLGDG